MAIVIEFYVPEKFRKRSGKWTPLEQHGTIVRFPTREKKSPLGRASKIGVVRNPGRKQQRTDQFERKPIMTYRIERFVIEGEHVTLRISGRIREQDVDTLRDCLEQEKNAVALDLKDILLVDWEAVRLLVSLESTGTELRNCPAYIREWITKERADRSA